MSGGGPEARRRARAARRLGRAALVAIVLALTWFLAERNGSVPDATVSGSGDEEIQRAFEHRESNLWVETAGVVDRLLSDDHDGARHQRFLLRLPSGLTLLIAHNIDLAPRLDALRTGDSIRLRGEYEWNPQGGVVHWTHHDPDRRHAGGWIEHEGRRYQ